MSAEEALLDVAAIPLTGAEAALDVAVIPLPSGAEAALLDVAVISLTPAERSGMGSAALPDEREMDGSMPAVLEGTTIVDDGARVTLPV